MRMIKKKKKRLDGLPCAPRCQSACWWSDKLLRKPGWFTDSPAHMKRCVECVRHGSVTVSSLLISLPHWRFMLS